MEKETVRFAVYGTLKRGHGNNRILRGAKFLGEFTTAPKYTLFDGGFPITERGGNTPISCEVFETSDPEVIKNVFNLEGSSPIQHHASNWYDWDEVATPYGDATIFVMDKGSSRRTTIVESGNWK